MVDKGGHQRIRRGRAVLLAPGRKESYTGTNIYCGPRLYSTCEWRRSASPEVHPVAGHACGHRVERGKQKTRNGCEAVTGLYGSIFNCDLQNLVN